MSTVTRPELSDKNEYWIEKHRYYELKHFCLQYPIWVEARRHLDGLSRNGIMFEKVKSSNISDPTAKCVEAMAYYDRKIDLVREAAIATDEFLFDYILIAVTKNVSYEYLRSVLNIPCSRDIYYRMYRKFFWILNKMRD